MDDLVNRGGLYYKQFTDVPFTGKVTGIDQGSFKNGERDGAWVRYWNNGQLREKVNFKNGKMEGSGFGYHRNGQLAGKVSFRNGKREGAVVAYNEDGTLDKERTGTYKNDKKISD